MRRSEYGAASSLFLRCTYAASATAMGNFATTLSVQQLNLHDSGHVLLRQPPVSFFARFSIVIRSSRNELPSSKGGAGAPVARNIVQYTSFRRCITGTRKCLCSYSVASNFAHSDNESLKERLYLHIYAIHQLQHRYRGR